MKKFDSQIITGIIVILFLILVFIYPRIAISLLIFYVATKIAYATYITIKYKKPYTKILTYGLGEDVTDVTLSKKQSIAIAFFSIVAISMLCILLFLILFDISPKQILNVIK